MIFLTEKWLVNTNDSFCKKVNKKDLLKWGKSLDNNLNLDLDYSVTEAINSLNNYGYKVTKLKENEEL